MVVLLSVNSWSHGQKALQQKVSRQIPKSTHLRYICKDTLKIGVNECTMGIEGYKCGMLMRERLELELDLYFFIFLPNVLIHICGDPHHAMTPVAGSRKEESWNWTCFTLFFLCV